MFQFPSQSRLPRFRRSSSVAPFQLTKRDSEIVHLVHRYRFLRSARIAALLGAESQHLLRRLQLLYHHGYLERPRAQLDYYHQGGSRHIVYGVGTKGAILLREEFGVNLKHLRWAEKNRSVGRMFLEHALLVSDIMVALELACRKTGRIRLLPQEHLSLPKSTTQNAPSFRWHVNLNSQLKLGVIPDQVFGLEFSKYDGTPNRAFFFLEADRGTMPVTRRNLSQTSFYRKLLAYEATWSQSLHQRFGFHRFRVLTVTNSEERIQSMVSACAELKRGHGLFLFAERTALLNSNDIFSAVWQTGRPDETATLLD
jgi:hypothetical protein